MFNSKKRISLNHVSRIVLKAYERCFSHKRIYIWNIHPYRTLHILDTPNIFFRYGQKLMHKMTSIARYKLSKLLFTK